MARISTIIEEAEAKPFWHPAHWILACLRLRYWRYRNAGKDD